MSKQDLPNIVIVCAGSAGSRAAFQLSKKLDFTRFNLVVINPRSYTILYPATARVVVSDRDGLKERIFVSIETVLQGKGRFVLGKVKKVEPAKGASGGSVTLFNGETIHYHALMLSPGVSWDNPINFPDSADGLEAYLASERKSFEKAEKIVLVGAGAVGLGTFLSKQLYCFSNLMLRTRREIRDLYPEKPITLVHGDRLPLNSFYPERFRITFQRSFEKRKIQLLLGDYIDTIPTPGEKIVEVKTRNGQTIKADLVVSTRGQRPNTELITEAFGDSTLTPRGLVKVEFTMQLPGHQEVFVVGDIIDWKEQKQAFKAQAHADIAVTNILRLLNGTHALKRYAGSFEFLFLTNGKDGGVTFLNIFGGITLGDWITRWGKSKSLIVSVLRGHIGV